MSNNIALIVLFSLIIIAIATLIKVAISIRKDKMGVNKDNMDEYVQDLRIMKTFEKLEKNNIENLIKVSGNPYHFNKFTWCLVKYIIPLFLIILSFVVYAFTEDLLYVFGILFFSFAIYWYPTKYYKDLVKDRERTWNKIHSHIWRISNSLDTNDSKKVCMEMKEYFDKIGEKELADGFEYFYELWPTEPEQIPETLAEFQKQFPFQIPKDLYSILLESWRNSVSSADRLESFRKTCELKYDKYSNDLLSKVPTTATMYSLPFLLVSVMAAILFPALLNIITALSQQ